MSRILNVPHPSPSRHGAARLSVLMVAPQPFFRPRGTPFSVLHRIRALLAAGHSVDLVTYPFGETPPLPDLRILRCGRPPFVRDVKVGPSLGKLLLDVPLRRATVRALKSGRYDVLHTHEEAAFFGMRLARRYGLLHVYDMHSSLPQQLKNFGTKDLGLARFVFRRYERKILETCDGVITICPDLAEIASRHCGATPHSMIENTGDDRAVFAEEDFDPLAEHDLRDKRIVLYTGTFEAYQGLDLLCDAVRALQPRHPRVHLLVAGGSPSQVEQQAAQAARTGLPATFLGTLPPGRIPPLLRAAEIIVSSRVRGTNTPLKVYSYLRSGKPLLATDIESHRQVLDDSVALLVPPTSRGFEEGLERLLSDEDARRNLAAAASARAAAKYSDENYLGKVAQFYARVAAARVA